MSVNDQVNFVNGHHLSSTYNTTVSHTGGYGNATMVNLANDSSFISNFSSSNESQKRDFVFDRTDVKVLFITLYSLVFCCCFFGKYKIDCKKYFLTKKKKNFPDAFLHFFNFNFKNKIYIVP